MPNDSTEWFTNLDRLAREWRDGNKQSGDELLAELELYIKGLATNILQYTNGRPALEYDDIAQSCRLYILLAARKWYASSFFFWYVKRFHRPYMYRMILRPHTIGPLEDSTSEVYELEVPSRDNVHMTVELGEILKSLTPQQRAVVLEVAGIPRFSKSSAVERRKAERALNMKEHTLRNARKQIAREARERWT